MVTKGGWGASGGMGGPGQPPMFDPNAPPTSVWQHMLGSFGAMMSLVGRITYMVDEQAHALHFFIGALLQLLDRFGSAYSGVIRFVLRILGFRSSVGGGGGDATKANGGGNLDRGWQATTTTKSGG